MISGIDYFFKLLSLSEKIDTKKNLKTVDIFSMMSLNSSTTAIEATIIAYLLTNGFKVNLVFCGGAIPSCEFSAASEKKIFGKRLYNSVCRKCIINTKKIKKINQIKNLKIIDLSDFSKSHSINKQDIINPNHSVVATKRALMSSTVNLKNKIHKEISLSLNFSLNIYSNLLQNYLSKYSSDFSILIHGIYLLHGPIVDLLSNRKKKFIVWDSSYKDSSIVYGINNRADWSLANLTYEEMINNMKGHYNKNLVNNFSKKLINRRKNGLVKSNIQFKLNKTIDLVGINQKNPTIVIFSNTLWDADVWYEDKLFKSHTDFLKNIVISSKIFKDINFVFSPHPIEGKNDYRENETVENLISTFTDIKNQENIFITNKLESSYSVAQKSNIIFVYGSSIGVELAALGYTVYAFANPGYINKGIVRSLKSMEEYKNLILNTAKRKFDGTLKNQVQKANDFIYYQNEFTPIRLPNLPKNLNASDQLFSPPDLSTIKSIQKSNLKKMIDEITSQ